MKRLKAGLASKIGAAIIAVVLLAGVSAPMVIGRWLDYSEEPRPSDVIVLLCGGDYARAVYAAELHRRGLAPEVWLARPWIPASVKLANGLGVRVLNDDEVLLAILLRKGVPPAAIHRYGDGVLSTLAEARALRGALALEGRRLLVVTSRSHARRSGLVFRRTFPRSAVRVCAPPGDAFPRAWWRDRQSATAALLEISKTVFYLLGGAFGPDRAEPGP